MTDPINLTADTVPPSESGRRLGASFWIRLLILALLLGGTWAVVEHQGLLASTVDSRLNFTVADQLRPLGGDTVQVTCPPGARFYAGATIVCAVAGVAPSALMPNLFEVNVYVQTHDQYRILPVSQP